MEEPKADYKSQEDYQAVNFDGGNQKIGKEEPKNSPGFGANNRQQEDSLGRIEQNQTKVVKKRSSTVFDINQVSQTSSKAKQTESNTESNKNNSQGLQEESEQLHVEDIL